MSSRIWGFMIVALALPPLVSGLMDGPVSSIDPGARLIAIVLTAIGRELALIRKGGTN